MNSNCALALALVCVPLTLLAAAPDDVTLAQTKEAHFRRVIEETSYQGSLPAMVAPSRWMKRSLLSGSYNARVFTDNGDEMAEDRTKLLYRFGTTVFVSFVSQPNHPFTGLLAAGAPHGILRVSLAAVPSDENPPRLMPGLALKFFIDGYPSVNIMAMPSLDEQMAPNIFEFSYRTDLQSPKWSVTGSVLENRFRSGLWYAGQPTGNPKSFSLDHLCERTSMGEKVSSPVTPYSIDFIPTEDLYSLAKSKQGQDFRSVLEGKGSGVVLFEVVARGSETQAPLLVGYIAATSPFTASAFGDQKLFFKHPKVHEGTTTYKDEF